MRTVSQQLSLWTDHCSNTMLKAANIKKNCPLIRFHESLVHLAGKGLPGV